MPGILPMKVIKVGSSSQSRIAQACDRCRSKKIRCDGIRPTCSQCASVGFECRTSDRLSRRAFPRGYTESLEERVRILENEVHELKDLLDSKDEKIDMLSRIHANTRKVSACPESPSTSESAESKDSHSREDTFRVQATPLLLGVENSDSYFMGSSSGRAFIEALKRRLQESGKSCNDFNPEAFLHVQGCLPLVHNAAELELKPPPRLFSDRCVNVYFQEWAPLFPILHKPTFLRAYEDFVADPEKVKSNHKIAQLHLVFSLAGLSLESPDLDQLAISERQWTGALETLQAETTMHTLQCLILALLYSAMRADYNKVQYYKALAVSLSHRLGLHQSQRRFAFGALTTETRKKVFWTLYTLDCFTAALLGLPKLLREEDVEAEYPCDIDDEYVTEKGFQPTLPGEHTRLSNSLALFRSARILADVLERIYPATATHELSLHQMEALNADLDAWYDGLPAHLRLTFVNDKPSTDVTGSRSPLLALALNYIRVLIFRPAVGSGLGGRAAHALITICDSSKHIIQIVELLQERRMSFSFCMNQSDLLMLCGMALLYQVSSLNRDSKLMQDNERLVKSVIKMVFYAQAPGSVALRRIASTLISVEGCPDGQILPKPARESSTASAPTQKKSPPSHTSGRRPSHSIGQRLDASVSEDDLRLQQEKMYALSTTNLAGPRPQPQRSASRQSFDHYRHPEPLSHREHRLSMSQAHSSGLRNMSMYGPNLNLDYLSLSHTTLPSDAVSPNQSRAPLPHQQQQHRRQQQQDQHQQPLRHFPSDTRLQDKLSGVSTAEWEALLGSMDGGLRNVYDAIYGGASLTNEASMPHNADAAAAAAAAVAGGEWSPDSWDLSNFSIGDFGGDPASARSVQSTSDESLSSGEEVAPSELGLSVSSMEYHGQMLSSFSL